MTKDGHIMIVASDIGGARAVQPIIKPLIDKEREVTVVDNGPLVGFCDFDLKIIDSGQLDTREKFGQYVQDNNVTTLCYATSVKDMLPLTLALYAKELGLKTVCLLDNWMNYRSRLELDGQLVLPDIYAVMDQLAYDESIACDIPKDNIYITGHPGLAILSDYQPQDIRSGLNIADDKKLLVFVMEPVAADQGEGPDNPNYRGYTEYSIMQEFYQKILPYKNQIHIGILPHPRQDKSKLYNYWQDLCVDISWSKLDLESGRDAVLAADYVAGMVSILLYESWLFSKPTLSFQSGLLRDDLRVYDKRQGCFCVYESQQADSVISSWLGSDPDKLSINPDLQLHKNSVGKLSKIIG